MTIYCNMVNKGQIKLGEDIMTNEQRAQALIEVLKPCLKKSRNKDWSTTRYYTDWGSKTEEGLKNTIVRIMTGEDYPGYIYNS